MVKDALLGLLEGSRGAFVSGEEVALRLGVSRNAVWKAAEALRREGYCIESVKNRGYRLAESSDRLSPQGIRKYLPASLPVRLEVIPSAASTNDLVRARAEAGESEGLALFAEEQTAGRGRLARPFYSPRDTGIYMSLLLRPVRYTAAQAVRITSAAAVAVCDAIARVSGRDARIKWVNDVYMNGKKICGILTEGSFSADGRLQTVVCGVGINLAAPDGGFPAEIADTAGAAFSSAAEAERQRAAVLAAALESLRAQYFSLQCTGKTGSEEEYRRRSLLTGRTVTVTRQNGAAETATVTGIDGECRLCVRWESTGLEEALIGGEVTLHGSRL